MLGHIARQRGESRSFVYANYMPNCNLARSSGDYPLSCNNDKRRRRLSGKVNSSDTFARVKSSVIFPITTGQLFLIIIQKGFRAPFPQNGAPSHFLRFACVCVGESAPAQPNIQREPWQCRDFPYLVSPGNGRRKGIKKEGAKAVSRPLWDSRPSASLTWRLTALPGYIWFWAALSLSCIFVRIRNGIGCGGEMGRVCFNVVELKFSEV